MSYLPGFVAGHSRRFNNHSVCTACGAMVDNEYLTKHDTFHTEATK